MRVAMYYSNRDIRLKEVPCPEIGPDELLVKIEASGICGSDLMEWYRINRVPLVLGHEVAGIIAQVGKNINNFKIGDKVVCAHHVPCGECNYCLSGHETVCETLRKTNFDPGGFAEFVRLPAVNVEKGTFLLPSHISFAEATFVEPLACVLRGQRQAGGVKGKRVLVIGSGIAGLLHIHLAKASGAAFITAVDIMEYRLKAAKGFGADVSIQAKEYSLEIVRKNNHGRLFDLVIVSTGAQSAILSAFESVERGGTILFFAPTDKGLKIPLPFNELFWRTEITLTSSYAGSPQDYKEALDLLANKKLNVSAMITHRLSLAETGLGFRYVEEARESIKVIIEPQR
jgi:L-iditol 2-dehydrogenase